MALQFYHRFSNKNKYIFSKLNGFSMEDNPQKLNTRQDFILYIHEFLTLLH